MQLGLPILALTRVKAHTAAISICTEKTRVSKEVTWMRYYYSLFIRTSTLPNGFKKLGLLVIGRPKVVLHILQ